MNDRRELEARGRDIERLEARVAALEAQHEDDVSRLMRAGVEAGKLEALLRRYTKLPWIEELPDSYHQFTDDVNRALSVPPTGREAT